jgi:hypothetical protein
VVNKLCFDAGGQTTCSFVIDAMGCLVSRSEAGDPGTLIPYAVEVVSSANELAHPFPWTITEAQVLGLMQGLPDAVKREPCVGSVIDKGELERFGFPLVPSANEQAHDSEIEAGLELLDSLPAGSVDMLQLEEILRIGGLVKIPRTDRYIETIHISTSASGPFHVVSDGWMTSMKVFRRSVVQFDQDKSFS